MIDPRTGIDPDIPLDRVVSTMPDDDAPLWVQITAMGLMMLIAGVTFYSMWRI